MTVGAFHVHSTYSDGVLTPTELVEEATSKGLRAIALADHDNVDGIPEALVAGERHGVEIVTGVELSVLWEHLDELHLLGYDHETDDEAQRMEACEIRLLGELGFEDPYREMA